MSFKRAGYKKEIDAPQSFLGPVGSQGAAVAAAKTNKNDDARRTDDPLHILVSLSIA